MFAFEIELFLDGLLMLFQETQELDIKDYDYEFNIIPYLEHFFRTAILLLQPSDLLKKIEDFIEFWVESLDFWKTDELIIFGLRIGV